MEKEKREQPDFNNVNISSSLVKKKRSPTSMNKSQFKTTLNDYTCGFFAAKYLPNWNL